MSELTELTIAAALATELEQEVARIVEDLDTRVVPLTGDDAAALIATDCPLDLHPREFKPGQCAQTRLAKAGMTIAPLADGSGFELIIRRSFADYLLLWLQDAAIAFE